MFAFELRWAAAVMGGFAPPGGSGLAPEPGEIDWARGVTRFLGRASAKGRLGVRVGLFLVVTAPLWSWGRLSSALALSGEERAALLDELLSHRWFIVRELCLLLKLVACMTLFAAPGMRERVHYDPVRDDPGRDDVARGERSATSGERRLPVLQSLSRQSLSRQSLSRQSLSREVA